MTRLGEIALGIGTAGAILYALFTPSAAPAEGCRVPRMPLAESFAIKRSMLPPGGHMDDYELDHIVPLCLCGTNDRSNLQLQLWSEAHRKDVTEAQLCRAVHHHELPLAEAQRIMRNWR